MNAAEAIAIAEAVAATGAAVWGFCRADEWKRASAQAHQLKDVAIYQLEQAEIVARSYRNLLERRDRRRSKAPQKRDAAGKFAA